VNKIGIRVKADASPFLGHGCAAKPTQVAAGNPDVDGFARHVQAPLGHSLCLLQEEQVACRRAKAGDHMDGVGSKLTGKGMEQIDKCRIYRFDRVIPVVAQKVIDLIKSIRNVVAFSPIG
jgi:hypothetical protein